MPNKSRNETELADPRQDRFETQLILGQIHGVLHFVVADTEDWFKGRTAQAAGEDDITAEDLRRSFADVSRSFGVVQAALNTGQYDNALPRQWTWRVGKRKRSACLVQYPNGDSPI